METPRTDPRSPTTTASHRTDTMNLTANQRLLAWIALGAGVIFLVWGFIRTPETGRAYKTSPGIEHNDAASRASTP